MIRQAISCDICGSEKKQTNHWFVAFDQGGELRISGWTSRNRMRPESRHLCGQTCMHKLVDEFMARLIAVRAQPGAADEVTAEVSVPDTLPAARPAPARISDTRIAATHVPAAIAVAASPTAARLIPSQQAAATLAQAAATKRPHPASGALLPAASTDASLISAAFVEPDLDFESSARLVSPTTPALPRRPPLRAQPELVPMSGRPHLEESPTTDEPPRLSARNWRAEAWDREREREQRASRDTGTSSRRRSGS